MLGKKVAFSAILGAVLLAAPARSNDKDDMKSVVDKLEKAVKDLKNLETSIVSNADQVRLVRDEIEILKNRLNLMQADLKSLRDRLDAPSSTSKRESIPPLPPSPGKLRLVNNYVEEMSVTVNDRSYRLVPGEDLTVTVPSGNYVYQIPQLQRFPQERKIAPNETKTIRVVVQP